MPETRVATDNDEDDPKGYAQGPKKQRNPVKRLVQSIRAFRQAWRKTRTTDRIVATCTIVIALSAIVQCVLSHKQWREMQSGGKQTGDMANATGKIADAAHISARAMSDSANTSRDAMNASSGQSKAALDQSISASRTEQHALGSALMISSNEPISLQTRILLPR